MMPIADRLFARIVRLPSLSPMSGSDFAWFHDSAKINYIWSKDSITHDYDSEHGGHDV
jgi:hypothetical protein